MMMKRVLYWLFLFLFITSFKYINISSADLLMQFDNQMRIKISSLDTSTNKYYNGFYSSDKLISRELSITDFKLISVDKKKIDHNIVFHITGIYNQNGFDIEKQVYIISNPLFKNMLFIQSKYINKGNKKLTVTSWESNKIRIKPTQLNNPIWSLQMSSTSNREDWILPIKPGFYQKNYMGMNNSDYGGGISVVDLWRKDSGIMIGLVETTLKLVSLPVEWVQYSDYATTGIHYNYDNPLIFQKGDTITTYKSFIEIHKGDFFDPLRQYSNYMQTQGIKLHESEDEAYEPVWCAWGYGRSFTIDEIINTLPKVKELGFKWVDVDDGYQEAIGDWTPNKRFIHGDQDMIRLSNAIHQYGLKAKIWWTPFSAVPCSNLLKNHPEMQLLTKDGTPEFITWWNSYYLSMSNSQVKKMSSELVKKFLKTWNFDGLKLDGQFMNGCPPDYNPDSGLNDPDQSIEKLPLFFDDIYKTSMVYKPDAVIQFCPCGCATNFFIMPYFNQAVASDPTSSWQIRLKGKVYRAIFKKIAYYGDHIELSDNGNDFASQVGIGAVVGSKFTYPKDNSDVKESLLLTPEKEKLYKKWVNIYNNKMLSKGTYLNLYDIAFDLPETHVIQKGDTMFYAFFSKNWKGKIKLRGLLKNKLYNVCEYTTLSNNTYRINGSYPYINVKFKGSYLIEVY